MFFNHLRKSGLRVFQLRQVVLMTLCLFPFPIFARSGCSVKAEKYFGWNAEKVSNRWVELTIVPELGGRLMQVRFGEHDFLFVNEELKGKVIPPDPLSQHWNNYGGDKIWPMPEGSDDEQHWPGAEGSLLDSAPYQFDVLSQGTTCSVRLTGPSDPFTGQQYIRVISINGSSPVISFHAVMKNTGGYPRSWSEQSVSQYNTSSSEVSGKINPHILGITAANPASAYLNGYHVRTGVAGNSTYSVEGGLFKVRPAKADGSGEVWIDSPDGWLSVADGASGYTMVERIRYQPEGKYPDKASMIFYVNAPRQRRAGGEEHQGSPTQYMEAEVNSPVVELAPGESYAMDTQWFPTRGGEDLKSVTFSGVVEVPLQVLASAEGTLLKGQFGSFYEGVLMAHFYGAGGASLGTAKVGDVSPLNLVDLSASIHPPAETRRVSLHVLDQDGVDRGPLGEAMVRPK
jgi:hypothetical protein